MDENLYKALKNIQKRPNMFFGKKSLEGLVNFSVGYICCMHDQGNSNIDFLQGFNEFIYRKYKLQGNYDMISKSYKDIILSFSTSEEDAFDKFFELLDEFLNEIKEINIQDYIKDYWEEHSKDIEKNH